MRILFCGDVMGRSGREAVARHVPKLREELGLDFVIVSADNASGGFGVDPKGAAELLKHADVLTGGDHIWDKKEIAPTLAQEKRLLRPHNFPSQNPGTGLGTYTLKDGRKVMVLHLLGQVFHKEHTHCPFATADEALKGETLGKTVAAIVVDFHAEASSEKNAMGVYLDGRVSAVVGSHTHVPTNDARILPKKTGYHTDAGMCGDYNSIIGCKIEAPMQRFLSKIPRGVKLEPADGEASLCATYIETDDTTGLCISIRPIIRGGILSPV